MKKTTNTLTGILKKTDPSDIKQYLKNNAEVILPKNRPFAQYMRACIRDRGLTQQEVFINAEISEGYGYKVLSEEKHVKQRDTILRICFGAHLTLEETQRALKIYGMSPLYPKFSRDAILIVAFSSNIYNLTDINRLLSQNNEKPLN